MNDKKKLLVLLYKIIPKGIISRLIGFLSRRALPGFILNPIISAYCKNYMVAMDEIDMPESGFNNFDIFFTRKLKPGIHKIDKSKNSIISPVDGRIDQFGVINKNAIIQAKGLDYTLESLVPSGRAKNFIDGNFITIYLSPADYHRIHSPVSGKINGYLHIPGKLYTVQEFMVEDMKDLYAINERIISFIEIPAGEIALCKIGAMGVGRISLSYDDYITNNPIRSRMETTFNDSKNYALKKGDEVGIFHLGSTVIILFQKNIMKFADLTLGKRIRMGEKIGILKK